MSVLDRFRLTDKVAMVTGAGKGIGAEIALAYADAGADVALLARTLADLEEIAAGIEERGRRALIVPTDVMDLDALPPAVERTVAELGGIDLLVNNAGGAVPARPHRPDRCDGPGRASTGRRANGGRAGGHRPPRQQCGRRGAGALHGHARGASRMGLPFQRPRAGRADPPRRAA